MKRYSPDCLGIVRRPLTRRTAVAVGDLISGVSIVDRFRITDMVVTRVERGVVWGLYGPAGCQYTQTMLRRDINKIDRPDAATGNRIVFAPESK